MPKPSFDLQKLLSRIRAHRLDVPTDNTKLFQDKVFDVGHFQTLSKAVSGVKLRVRAF